MSLAPLPSRSNCYPRCAQQAVTSYSTRERDQRLTGVGVVYSQQVRAARLQLRNDEPSLRVTSVHPGRIATVMQEGLVAYEGKDYDPSRYLSPEAVAKVVADAVNAPPDAHIHEVIVRPR